MARRTEARVEDALSTAAANIVCISSGEWRLSLANGCDVPAYARIVDGWLELTTALPPASILEPDPLSWLRFNARLDGSARVARTLDTKTLQLRTDLHIEGGTDLDERVTAACEEVTAALHLLEGAGEELMRPSLDGPVTTLSKEDAERLCTEAGWPCTVRAAEDLGLNIEMPAGIFGVRLESSNARSTRLVVELTHLNEQSAGSQRAIAVLLLVLSSAVRSVRGVIVEREGVTIAGIASALESVTAQALDRSLSALSVACQLAGREVRGLHDERLAAEYLSRFDVDWESHSHAMKEEETCLQPL
jgi:hypothetical protein